MNLWAVLAIVFVPMALTWLVLWWWERRTIDRIMRIAVQEFRAAFPGRCMVCSYQRWGFEHGHARTPKPDPHSCIEELH